ncbi:uncharacterized protein LOC120270857 [Dioscorea cayenensis subsp. rotundata]|uniref:Uncharacterized protein LOC120270857 n=1 Tax=Dioscorea cayennensis subsp. rotundata TaxID=55577 RepID=A0AB40C271_DIOCR|nr:uncharacterized protein LOC120270857 [Dioscorea cayenensis subsp. rotundata]
MGNVELKGRNGGGGWGQRWVCAMGALIAVLLATAVTSRTSPKIPLFRVRVSTRGSWRIVVVIIRLLILSMRKCCTPYYKSLCRHRSFGISRRNLPKLAKMY